jgi:hypothetical protein
MYSLRIVTHVHGQRLACHGVAKGGALVRKAAQAGALLGLAGLVVGVDLDDVALGVHLVAVVVAAVGGGAGLAVVPAQVLSSAPPVSQPWRDAAPAAAVTLERGDALVVAARGIVGSAAVK